MTTAWMSTAEAGASWGIRFVVFLCTAFGRGAARVFLRVLAFYYVLFSARARRASRLYFERLHPGEPVGFWRIYGHVLTFAKVTLDRVFFAKGRTDLFEVTFTGEEHMRRLRDEKKGAVFLLAHLGSFDSGRAFSEDRDFKINIVGYFRNARMINETLERLNPKLNLRLIDLTPDSVDFVFKVEERIAAGEIVATMGDRVGKDGKSAVATFLGAPARFPTGTYQLAAVLGCPVYLAFGLYTEPNRYDLHCELFAEKIVLPRKGREEALAALVQRYAARLEEYCRRADNNWFNFFDFWESAR
jgi:predicted LPLAT superfamily acyltransferase